MTIVTIYAPATRLRVLVALPLCIHLILSLFNFRHLVDMSGSQCGLTGTYLISNNAEYLFIGFFDILFSEEPVHVFYIFFRS